MWLFKSLGVCVLLLFSQPDYTTSEDSENVIDNVGATYSTTLNESEVLDMLHGNFTNVFEKENMTEVSGDLDQDIDEAVNGTFDTAIVTDIYIMNSTGVLDWANFSALPIIKEPENLRDGPTVGTAESAVILAATFMVLAAVGYGGMVAWRRMLQVRYDTRDMLITDDVYDITDLRNFEIA